MENKLRKFGSQFGQGIICATIAAALATGEPLTGVLFGIFTAGTLFIASKLSE